MMQKLRDPYWQGHIWTVLSSGAAAVIGSVTIWLTTRLLGVEQAGILSYAVAVVMVVQLFAAFGVTSYHATDTTKTAPFLSYFALRCVTMLFSLFVTICFMLFSGQDAHKAWVVLLLFAFYLLWSGGAVFENELQRKGKQYISGRISFARSILAMLLFSAVLLSMRNLMVGVATMAASSALVGIIGVWVCRNEFGALRQKPDIKQMRMILMSCFPLFCSGLLWTLSMNIPRYFLSAFHSDEVLGVFSILAMPASLITVFTSSLFNGPELTRVSILINNGEYEQFRKRILRQILVVVAVSVIVLISMYFAGLPLLRFIFGIDFSQYLMPFMVTVSGGCLLALNSLFGLLLIVIRKQMHYLIGGVIGVLMTLPAAFHLVPTFGINGAAWSSVMMYPVTSVFYGVVLFGVITNFKTKFDKPR